MVVDQEFADDTSLYLKGTPENLEKAKEALTSFSLASGANINSDKTHAFWISSERRFFAWEEEQGLQWNAPGDTVRYLGFQIGFQTNAEDRFKAVLQAIKRKLSYWATTKLSLAGRILIANQVLLLAIWYVASCWGPHLQSIQKIKALIRNYLWSGEDGERRCIAKVAWDSLIQPRKT